jgi:hypothetical protein
MELMIKRPACRYVSVKWRFKGGIVFVSEHLARYIFILGLFAHLFSTFGWLSYLTINACKDSYIVFYIQYDHL